MLQISKLSHGLLLLAGVSLTCPSGSAFATVVASIRPLGFIAAAIAEGVMPVEVLLPDGASPHNYALRPSDIQRLRAADLVIWVGPKMESSLTKALIPVTDNKKIALSELPAVKPLLIKNEQKQLLSYIAKGIDKEENEDDDYHAKNYAKNHGKNHGDKHFHGDYNMHIWLSLSIVKQAAIAIHYQLSESMPQNRDKLDTNLRQFELQLTQTEKNVATTMKFVHGKGYFVFHDAFSYFENHFGLAPLGYFTVNPEITPGPRRLYQIRKQLIQKKAVCVFSEPQFRPAVIDTVIKDTGVRSGTLDPFGGGVALNKDGYANFLFQLSRQYVRCLSE